MPNETPAATADPVAAALSMLDAGMSGMIARLIQANAGDVTGVINLLCEHIGRLLSLVEPLQARNSVLAEIRRNLPAVVERHVQARMTTPGGVIVPPAGLKLN